MLPNLPILFNWTNFQWSNNENLESTINKGCVKRPKIINIQEVFQMNQFHTFFTFYGFLQSVIIMMH